MELSLFLSMVGFLWVAAITPGPNNMLLTSTGANFGFMRSIWLMLGIMLGMQSMLLLVAFGVGSLILIYPSLHLALKILGSLYLLWLAWKIATSAYEKLDTNVAPAKPLRLYQGWLLQFLNPKAWLNGVRLGSQFQHGGRSLQSLHLDDKPGDVYGESGGRDYLAGFWHPDWPPARQPPCLVYL